jgi:DNA-binding NarL/FixJ family response regulator
VSAKGDCQPLVDKGAGVNCAGKILHADRQPSPRRRGRSGDSPCGFTGEVAAAAPGPAGEAHPLARLTRREVEVDRLVADGSSNPEIARRLFVSEKTVETHLTHILTKLGLRNRVQVARWAAELEQAGSW